MDNNANASNPDTAVQAPVSAGEVVTISRAELEELREAASRNTADSRVPRETQNPLNDEIAAARERRVSELEGACKSAVRERELATTLAGKALVPGAAAQLIKLWSGEFDVYEEEGRFKVSSRDGRAVSEVVNDWLASSEYSHFCLPTSRGGTGSKDSSRPAGASAATTVAKTLGEAIVMKWREEAAAQPGNLLKPIGLRRDR